MGRTGYRRYRRERAAVLQGELACWLCGQPIDTTLAWPHPQSPSADHATAYANGGADTRDNLRPAHLGCNARRGKRDRGTILRRSQTLAPHPQDPPPPTQPTPLV